MLKYFGYNKLWTPPNDNLPISISFSGGRSSAVMAKIVSDMMIAEGREFAIVFANTGAEHPNTLDFVRDCEIHWGLPIVWVEARFQFQKRKGVRHKIVNYETASRDGLPFKGFVLKHGIPSPSHPQCTTYLKTMVIRSYLQNELKWDYKEYYSCVGIRADEIDRMSSQQELLKLLYPLIDLNLTKEDILKIMAQEDFDLDLPGEHYGNCVTCWKKDDRKLFTIAQDNPEFFNLFKELEKYKDIEAKNKNNERRFYRHNRTVQDILDQAKLMPNEERFLDINKFLYTKDIDESYGCEDSCEPYSEDEVNRILKEIMKDK